MSDYDNRYYDYYDNGRDDDDDDDQPQGVEVDCPTCGSDAIYNDSGITCSNSDCENS